MDKKSYIKQLRFHLSFYFDEKELDAIIDEYTNLFSTTSSTNLTIAYGTPKNLCRKIVEKHNASFKWNSPTFIGCVAFLFGIYYLNNVFYTPYLVILQTFIMMTPLIKFKACKFLTNIFVSFELLFAIYTVSLLYIILNINPNISICTGPSLESSAKILYLLGLLFIVRKIVIKDTDSYQNIILYGNLFTLHNYMSLLHSMDTPSTIINSYLIALIPTACSFIICLIQLLINNKPVSN